MLVNRWYMIVENNMLKPLHTQSNHVANESSRRIINRP